MQAAAGQPVTSTELDYLLSEHGLKAHPGHVWQIDHIRREERKRQKHKHMLFTERSALQVHIEIPGLVSGKAA